MHCCDPRQARIVCIQGRRDGRKAWHEPVDRGLAAIGSLQQPVNLVWFTNDKASIAPLYARRLPEQQAIVSAG
jgi:hypothetical protein